MNVKNRGCIRRLSFKTLLASRKRNLIAIAAIVLTTLLFTSLFTVAMSINSSYEMYAFRQAGGYCHGNFKEVTEEQLTAISAHPKIKATGVRLTIGFQYGGVFAKTPAEVSFMDENCTKWSFAQPDVGRIPKEGKEVIMDTGALKLLGVEPVLGAQIPFTFEVGDQSQRSYEKTDTFTLVGWWDYDDISPVHYINVSREYAEKVEAEGVAAGMEPFRRDLNVMLGSSMDIRGQMEQVDRDLGYTWDNRGAENNVRIGVNWGYTSSQLGENMDASTVAAMAAFLALVIFTGYLIIYNIFQISVTGDIRFYGLLKTIGVTPRQLRRIIRQQALLLCLVGIPVGMLLGYGVGALLTPAVTSNLMSGSMGTTISTSPLIFIASGLFALLTVLLSCSRPGRIAGRISPVEATRYTETSHTKKKRRATRGARVHQMAFANLGRNRSKTALVVISLALSVVLLNILVTFTAGFDMEKFLAKMSCADFIVSSTDYFRSNWARTYISREQIQQIQGSTQASLSGVGYVPGTVYQNVWMREEAWKAEANHFSASWAEQVLPTLSRRDGLVMGDALIEGLDESLLSKLQVLDGDLGPLLEGDSHSIAIAVHTDDYGNPERLESYPRVGETLPVTYVEEFTYLDGRTGEPATEDTPGDFLQMKVEKGTDITYTVCAWVVVPNAMSHRHGTLGYELALSREALEADSGSSPIPLFYLFDTPDEAAEKDAESYLAQLTAGNQQLMYESKASLRAEFKGFQDMFLLLGGALCAIIGLVGALNFFNAILTSILSRKREFAVLQAVGMTNRQMKTMLVCEGLCYTLGSVAAALLLSLVITPLAGNLLEAMFWFFSARFTVVPILLTLPVFALLGYAIPAMMYRHAAKQSVVERLRETE